jgi:regulator of sigma E protease
MIVNIVFAILGLSVIIAIHEIGHLITAKKAGMKVERFGIGMGPSIFCFKHGGTEYCLCWVPIGGFCQIKGEDAENKDPDSFNAKPPFSKFIVAFSGPFANFVTAFLLIVILINLQGNPVQQVARIEPDFPALSAGVQIGDRLKGIDEIFTEDLNKLTQYINQHANKEITLHIERNKELIQLPLVPKETDREISKGTSVKVGLIGVAFQPVYEKVSFFTSISLTLRTMGKFFVEFLRFIGKLITGRMDPGVQVAGPIKIVGMAAETVSVSWLAFLFFIAFLSLNLGMLNLFPFPPLDGGKILFAIWEGISKKPVNKKFEIWVNTAGFLLLIGLMLFVTFKDIVSFF